MGQWNVHYTYRRDFYYYKMTQTLTTSSWEQVLSWSCSSGQACGFCSQPESGGTWHPCPAKTSDNGEKRLKCTEWILLEISKLMSLMIINDLMWTFHHLSVPFQVLPHSNSFLDEVVKILRQVRGQAFGLQDPEDLVASDKTHLSNTMGIPQDHT